MPLLNVANFGLAFWARVKPSSCSHWVSALNNGFYSILPAIWTKPVNWLFKVIYLLVNIEKNTTSQFLKFILLFSLRPLFKFHQFLCKIVFFLQQILIFRLHRKGVRLYGKDYAEQIGNTLVSINFSLERAYALCDIIGRFGGGNKR